MTDMLNPASRSKHGATVRTDVTGVAVPTTMLEGPEMDLIACFSGLRGLVEVNEVAGQLAMLASSAGRGFHGSCLAIDAGITAG